MAGDILTGMPSDVNYSASPTLQFITDVIEPRRDEIQLWRDVKKHQDILLEDAQKRRRTTAVKLGSGFLLKREGQRIGGLDAGVTTLVSGQALQSTQSLEVCHAHLRASQVPTVSGRSFHVSDRSSAEEYRRAQGSPLTVRPGTYLGKPVVSLRVSSAQELDREWERAGAALVRLKSARQQIYLENFSDDLSLRVFVVGEDVVAAVARMPFYLVGDGRASVHELVEAERKRRSACENLSQRFPVINADHLGSMGVTTDQVLDAGEVRTLPAEPHGAAGGGVNVDILNDLSDELKSLAIDAMWSFPGLNATAVDIRTPALDSAAGARVADVIPQANLSEFTYPAYGEPRRCGVWMIDHMIKGR